MLFDLHLHSRFSIDALSKPGTIVKVCKKNGWGFSLTDHNNMDAYRASGPNNIKKLAKSAGVFLVPGEEIKVVSELPGGRLAARGEVIAYFLSKPIPSASFEEIVDSVKSQGALLSCPHPFDWPRKNFKEFPQKWKSFDCVETYNARAYYQGLNRHSRVFAEGKSIAKLGVSDAHTPQEIGNGLTEIDAADENEFRKEIKKGRTKVVMNGKANIWHHFQTQLARRRWIEER
jgi:hypothetical protein